MKTKWPDKRGLFKCLVDGKKKVLTHHYCANNNKHWWTTTDGYDVVGCEVEVIEELKIKT